MEYIAICSQWSDSVGAIQCSGQFAVIPVSDLLTRFSADQLDTEVLAAMFGAGFGLVAVFEMVGNAVRTLFKIIKGG